MKRFFRLHRVFAAVVMLAYVGLLSWEAYCHSPTYLEIGHLPAGISHWQYGRFELFAVNPPLVRVVAAVPVLLVGSETDWSSFSTDLRLRPWHEIGQDYLRRNGNRSLWLFTLSRWACIPFGLIGAYICYRWTNRLAGSSAGLMALLLWCFSPYVLGHGATINADVPSAALGLAAAYCFWQWLKRPMWLEAIFAGIVLGLAELCKFTLLVFYPLFPLLWIIYRLPEHETTNKREWASQGAMLATTLAISVWVINCGYLFEGTFTPLKDFRFQSMLFTGQSASDFPPEDANRFSRMALGILPVPLPLDYLCGIDIQQSDFERGLPSYLRGEWADHGWWYYYLYAMAVKEPLGTWCLVVLAIGTTLFGRGYSASWRDEIIVLAPLVLLLICVSSQAGFSVHSRYVIPALPFIFVWTSKVARVFELCPFTGKRLAFAATVVLALAWSIGSSLAVYPHSLSYFNELAGILPTRADTMYPQSVVGNCAYNNVLSAIIMAGPRNGPRHLLDSNIDWGQDLLHLKKWLDNDAQVRLDGLVCFGSFPPSLAGIPETAYPLPVPFSESHKGCQTESRNWKDYAPEQPGPKPGWYALSVNYLYGRDPRYRYFLHFHPIATAGYSIYIYHITIDEANRVRRELGLPELETEGKEGAAEGREQNGQYGR